MAQDITVDTSNIGPAGSTIDPADFTTPFGDLEGAIEDLLNGTQPFDQLNFETATELTIASGVITVTQSMHTVDTESDAASDDLDTITGADGDVLYLLPADDARTVVLKHGTGNIVTGDGSDRSLDNTGRAAHLVRFGSTWVLVGFIETGGGGGMTSFTVAGDTGGGQTITDGNTLSILGGTGIGTADSATDTVTVNLDIDKLDTGTPVDTDTLVFKDVDDTNTPKEATIATILALGGGGSTPRGHIIGLEVNVTGDEAITIAEGQALDDTHAVLMSSANGGGSVDMTTTGINALDTGTIASDTIYYVWMCSGGSGTGFIASLSATTPTLPTGYDDNKRYVGAVVTDATSDLIKQKTVAGGGCKREVRFTEVADAAPYRILNAADLGNGSGAATAIDCSGLLPTTSRYVIAYVKLAQPAATINTFWFVNSVSRFMYTAGSFDAFNFEGVFEVSSSQVGAAYGDAQDENMSFYIHGYIDNLSPDLISA